MRQRKGFSRMLGLSLLAMVAVLAVSAASAQAADFRVGGVTFTAAGLEEESASGTGAAGLLLVTNGTEIECTSSDLTANLKKGGTGSGVVLFLGCDLLKDKFCTIYESEEAGEENKNPGMLTASGTGKLVLHGGAHYLELTGLGASKLFTTVYFAGPGCTLEGLPKEVTGNTVVLLPTALENLVNQKVKTVNAATETLLNVALKYGGERASLDNGEVTNAHLIGKNVGKTFGAE